MAKLDIQQTVNRIEANFLKKELPFLQIGDNVRVGVKIIEGGKERVQFYEGTILARKNTSINTTITVRKILQGIGIERIFLIHSPKIDSILNNWLYFSILSDRHKEPVLICEMLGFNEISAMVLSDVSPERCEIIVV